MISLRDAIYAASLEDQPYADIANYFNERPLIDNPEAQQNIPAPLSLEGMLTILTDEEEGNVLLLPGFAEWAGNLKKSTTFTKQAELTAVVAASVVTAGTAPRAVTEVIGGLIDAGQRTALQQITECLAADATPPTLGSTTRATILAAIDATIPDPSYQTQIAGPARYESAGLTGPVTTADVQGALN